MARGNAIDPWPFVEGVPDHPGYALTPSRVLRIFRESESGDLRELQDLYDDLIESDGHLRALFNSRVQPVGGKGWVIQPGGPDPASIACAKELETALEDEELDTVDHFEHQLEAPFRGYSASEIEWGLRGDYWVPVAFDDVAHRRFRFVPGTNELRLRPQLGVPSSSATASVYGEELWPNKWVQTKARHSNLARAGLFRTATWWCLFKRLSMRDWVVFAERFGIPFVVGYYNDDTTEEARKVLELALRDIGEGGSAVLHEATRIAIEEAQRTGDAAEAHPAIVARCDAEISKLMTGATLTVESGGPGSFALGKVHENRAFALEIADANRLERVFRRQVALPFARLNGFTAAGAKPPRLNIQVLPELDPSTRVKLMGDLVDRGADIDVAYESERLGFRRALDEANRARTKGGAAPGSEERDVKPDNVPDDRPEGEPEPDQDDDEQREAAPQRAPKAPPKVPTPAAPAADGGKPLVERLLVGYLPVLTVNEIRRRLGETGEVPDGELTFAAYMAKLGGNSQPAAGAE